MSADVHATPDQAAAAAQAAAFAHASRAKERAAALRGPMRAFCEELCVGLGPLLEPTGAAPTLDHACSSRLVAPSLTPSRLCPGRCHVLTPNVLDSSAPFPYLRAEDGEEAFAMSLEAALGGRPVAINRGEPFVDDSHMVALDRETINVTHVYFHSDAFKHWQFSRNRLSAAVPDPNAQTVAGIQDAADLRQTVLTYVGEIPFLYSIMIGSFLMIFVPESCTSYAPKCSSKENLGTNTRSGEFVLTINCLTAFCFVIAEYCFNRRETFLIEYLDADDEYPPNHLPHIIDRYPRIKRLLRSHNARCAALSSLTTVMIIFNFIVSAVFVLRRVGHEEKVCCPGIFPGETKTITTLLTNTLLVLIKMLRHVRTTKRSLLNNMGVSSVHMLPSACARGARPLFAARADTRAARLRLRARSLVQRHRPRPRERRPGRGAGGPEAGGERRQEGARQDGRVARALAARRAPPGGSCCCRCACVVNLYRTSEAHNGARCVPPGGKEHRTSWRSLWHALLAVAQPAARRASPSAVACAQRPSNEHAHAAMADAHAPPAAPSAAMRTWLSQLPAEVFEANVLRAARMTAAEAARTLPLVCRGWRAAWAALAAADPALPLFLHPLAVVCGEEPARLLVLDVAACNSAARVCEAPLLARYDVPLLRGPDPNHTGFADRPWPTYVARAGPPASARATHVMLSEYRRQGVVRAVRERRAASDTASVG